MPVLAPRGDKGPQLGAGVGGGGQRLLPGQNVGCLAQRELATCLTPLSPRYAPIGVTFIVCFVKSMSHMSLLYLLQPQRGRHRFHPRALTTEGSAGSLHQGLGINPILLRFWVREGGMLAKDQRIRRLLISGLCCVHSRSFPPEAGSLDAEYFGDPWAFWPHDA